MKKLPKVRCDQWRSGVCQALIHDLSKVVYCPRPRAENCRQGECCHHPMFEIRPMLVDMKNAGVKLRRYGAKIKNPAFVKKLYSAFLKARSKRSSVSSRTSGRS